MAERVFEASEPAPRPERPSPPSRERMLPDMQSDVLRVAAGGGWAQSKEGLAQQLEAMARETHPDRHLIVDCLKEAVGLLYQEREPTVHERQHLVFAARGLDSSLPTFWRYSAREAASALRDPAGGAVPVDPTSTNFTRQEFENYLAFLTPKR
jgi:hypothetical protein